MKFSTRIALRLFPSYVWIAIKKELFINKCTRQVKSAANKKKLERVKAMSYPNIQLGCGKRNFKDWVNVDIFRGEGIDLQLNFREPLPFDSNSVNLIYSEHVLEHLFKDEAEALLKECNRVLKPGGMLRLGVPDAETYFRKYAEGDRAYFSALQHLGGATTPLATPADVINQMFRMGGDHLFAWDFETLQLSVKKAGFNTVQRKESGKSSLEMLCLDDPAHAFETLYIETVKQ